MISKCLLYSASHSHLYLCFRSRLYQEICHHLKNLEDILQCRLYFLQTLKYLILSSLISEVPELISSLCSLRTVMSLNILTHHLLSRQHINNVCMIYLTEQRKVDIHFQLQKLVQFSFATCVYWNLLNIQLH